MRTRLVLLGVGAVVALVAVVLVVVVVLGDDGPTGADRAALDEVAREPSSAALDGVVELAADADRWGRLVGGGGPDVAALLDAAQPALGQETDPAALVGPVVEPFVEGDDVDGDVAMALARWTWPLLAADLGSPTAQERAGAVLARAERGDRAEVQSAVLLARLHRTLTSRADRASVVAWRADLARSALSADTDAGSDDLASALRSGDLQDQPADLLRGVLATWGPPSPRASEPARTALAAGSDDDPDMDRGGAAITIASYLAVIDETDDTAAAAVVARVAAGEDPLTEDDASLVAVEDALFNVPDPALAAASETATLLRTA